MDILRKFLQKETTPIMDKFDQSELEKFLLNSAY